GTIIAHEFLDLVISRRQAEKVVASAANERAAIRLGRRFETGGFEAREDEVVDGSRDPRVRVRALARRRLGPLKRTEGPGQRLVQNVVRANARGGEDNGAEEREGRDAGNG